MMWHELRTLAHQETILDKDTLQRWGLKYTQDWWFNKTHLCIMKQWTTDNMTTQSAWQEDHMTDMKHEHEKNSKRDTLTMSNY